MKTFNKLDIFINRLQKINIVLKLVGNYPWIYIDSINGKKVRETFQGNHGFTIAFLPIKSDQELKNILNNMDKVKMFLFARWISTNYADEHLDEELRYVDNKDFDSLTAKSVLNMENGEWWKKQLNHFNNIVYPIYLKNGTVNDIKEYLKNEK